MVETNSDPTVETLNALCAEPINIIGHCSVSVGAGTLTEVVQRYFNWNARSKGVAIVKKVRGILVILGGVYLLWTA